MTQEISEYTLLKKRLTGQTLKLFFAKKINKDIEMVLELVDVASFIDNYITSEISTLFLSIDQTAIYGIDMAMRLNRPELTKFQEVFLSTDPKFSTTIFRGIAEKINWRQFNGEVYGDLNY